MINTLIPQSEVVILSAVCALAGSIVLSRFTVYIGTLTYLVNFCTLFAGALAANVIVTQFYAPLDNSLQRPLIIALCGMMVVAIGTLAVMSRGRYSG